LSFPQRVQRVPLAVLFWTVFSLEQPHALRTVPWFWLLFGRFAIVKPF